MKSRQPNKAKEVYQQLRSFSFPELWEKEVPKFDRANEQERFEQVGLIRALGVVAAESSNESEKEQVRAWLRKLLQDPNEKIRRYALNALPKLGSGTTEEHAVLSLLKKSTGATEKKFLGKTLNKIGGKTTLETPEIRENLSSQTLQKVKANVARGQFPGGLKMERSIEVDSGIVVHLRCRRGLENFVREELEQDPELHKRFQIREVRKALVIITALKPFCLQDLYRLRCFKTTGFFLGLASTKNPDLLTDELAGLIASPFSQNLFKTLTDGPIRYRLEFIGKGPQRGAVSRVVSRAFELCPEILNDSRQATWAVEVYSTPAGHFVELRPRLSPDPRFAYRQQDVPAASHPPLAASMARLAGVRQGDVIWDPFCGSGLELIESSRLGNVQHLYGTDLSAEAVEITRRNLASAGLGFITSTLACGDFRDFRSIAGLGPETVSLIISNPPMGRRVPIPDLAELIKDLFHTASVVLKPEGRLVFANPLRMESPERSLQRQYRQTVDLGGFEVSLEKYVKK